MQFWQANGAAITQGMNLWEKYAEITPESAQDGGQRHAVSPNILDRSFVASAPNQKWIADCTYIWTAQGWLYVAAVVDL